MRHGQKPTVTTNLARALIATYGILAAVVIASFASVGPVVALAVVPYVLGVAGIAAYYRWIKP